MNRAEQERLVERYLGSAMAAAEEEEFFLNVAVDRELRQTLKAYRIVESALRKHRTRTYAPRGRARARLVTLLETDTVPSGTAGLPGAAAAPQRTRRRGMLVFGTMCAMAGMLVGVYFVAPMLTGREHAANGGAHVQAPAASMPNRIEPIATESVVTKPIADGTRDARAIDRSRADAPTAPGQPHNRSGVQRSTVLRSRAHDVKPRHNLQAAGPTVHPALKTPATTEQQNRPPDAPTVEHRQRVVLQDKNLKLRVKVVPPEK